MQASGSGWRKEFKLAPRLSSFVTGEGTGCWPGSSCLAPSPALGHVCAWLGHVCAWQGRVCMAGHGQAMDTHGHVWWGRDLGQVRAPSCPVQGLGAASELSQLLSDMNFPPAQDDVDPLSSSHPPLPRHPLLLQELGDACIWPLAFPVRPPPLLPSAHTLRLSNPLVFAWASFQGHPPLYRATAK